MYILLMKINNRVWLALGGALILVWLASSHMATRSLPAPTWQDSHTMALNWDGAVFIEEWMKTNSDKVPVALHNQPAAPYRFAGDGWHPQPYTKLARQAFTDAARSHPDEPYLEVLCKAAQSGHFSLPLYLQPIELTSLIFPSGPKNWKKQYVQALCWKDAADAMVRRYPDLAISYFARSVHEEENAQAVPYLDKAIMLDPAVPVYYLYRGRARQHGLKDLFGARADFQQAVQLQPLQAMGWAHLCEIQFYLENYQDSIAAANKALELFPDYGHAYLFRGQAYHALRQYHLAIADYTIILRDHPDFYWAPELRAYSKLALGDVAGAIEDFNAPAEHDHSHVIHRLGVTYLVNHQPEEAIYCFRTLSGLWGTHWICISTRLQGNVKDATAQIHQLRRENPTWMDGWLLDYALSVLNGETPDMHFTPASNASSHWPQPLVDMVQGKISFQQTLAMAKPNDSAMSETRASLLTNSRIAQIHLMAGYQALQQKQKKTAAEHFARAEENAAWLSYSFLLARSEREFLAQAKVFPATAPRKYPNRPVMFNER